MAINRSKERPLWRLIYALGIRHVGEKASFVLAERFKTLDNLIKAEKGEIDGINEVGSVIADSVTDYFSQAKIKDMVDFFRAAGINLKKEEAPLRKTPFTGKTVVFTGELKGLSRDEAQELIRNSGGNPSSSLSSKTDFLVSGENPGSKLKNARKLGVKIIDEKKLKEMIK